MVKTRSRRSSSSLTCVAIALGRAAVVHCFFLGRAREKNVIRFEMLLGLRQAQVVGPSKAEPLENFIEQFLSRKLLVVARAGDITFFVKLLAKMPDRFRLAVIRPPSVTCVFVFR